MEWALTLGGSVLFAEFTGYWVHRLLHSERIPYLSRSHMIHHLRDYGPDTSMRPSASYRKATDTRGGIAGIGFEWLLPIALSLCVVLSTLTVLGVGLWPQLLFSLCSIGWGVLMFSYMHDSMHCRNFWMERHSLLRNGTAGPDETMIFITCFSIRRAACTATLASAFSGWTASLEPLPEWHAGRSLS